MNPSCLWAGALRLFHLVRALNFFFVGMVRPTVVSAPVSGNGVVAVVGPLSVTVWRDHLSVTVAGAPWSNVTLEEVGLKSQNVGVGGAFTSSTTQPHEPARSPAGGSQ
jgi:hypothetical protein